MRILTEKPFNAETPAEALRSWITPNAVFFHRNQSEMKSAVSLPEWRLSVEGEVGNPREFAFDDLLRLPKAIAANTWSVRGTAGLYCGRRPAATPGPSGEWGMRSGGGSG